MNFWVEIFRNEFLSNILSKIGKLPSKNLYLYNIGLAFAKINFHEKYGPSRGYLPREYSFLEKLSPVNDLGYFVHWSGTTAEQVLGQIKPSIHYKNNLFRRPLF